MRRAMTSIDGETVELKLRNISSMGALVECRSPVAPGAELTIDIVGVGPVRGDRALGAVGQVRSTVRRPVRPRPARAQEAKSPSHVAMMRPVATSTSGEAG